MVKGQEREIYLGFCAFEEIGGEVVQSVAFVLEKDGVNE